MILDDRYRIIKPKFDDGRIRHFSDIIKIVPKTRLAKDIGKSNVRLNKVINQIDTVEVGELVSIGHLAELSLMEMLSIIESDCAMPRPKVKDERFDNVNVVFRAGNIRTLEDIFRYVPKSLVGPQLKMKQERLARLIFKVSKFEIRDVLLIGGLFRLTKKETFRLIVKSYEEQNSPIKKRF
jgi:hypothetical protein